MTDSANPPLNVLIVMPLAEQRGGGELVLLYLLEHGRNLGVTWTVVFLQDGPMAAAVRGWQIDVHVIEAGRLRQPQKVISTIFRMRQLIRRIKPDLVFGWMVKAQLFAGPASWWAGVPAVWYQHGLPDPPAWYDRAATRLPAIGILACSNSTALAQGKLRPQRPVHTVYPAVDLARFDPSALPLPAQCRQLLNLPSTGPLIGIVGRLQRWKGMHHFVEAMVGVLTRYPDAHGVIVGGDHAFEPDYPAFLNQRITDLKLSDKIILTGLQSNVPIWMQAMDVIVHASDAEPFGIVIVEAMALGKPVVATNTAGPTEIITDGVDGLLWPSGQPDVLGRAILRLLNDPSLAASLAERARLRAADFSTQRFARNVVHELRSFLQADARTLSS